MKREDWMIVVSLLLAFVGGSAVVEIWGWAGVAAAAVGFVSIAWGEGRFRRRRR